MLRILPFLLILPLLVSTKCKQKPTSGPTEVSGYTVDKFTGKRVPQIPVYFLSRNTNLAWGGYGSTRAGTSDSIGFYSFTFEAKEESEYKVNSYDLHLYTGAEDDGSDIKKGQKNSLNVPMHPFGWVKLHIRNENPKDTVFSIYCSTFFKPSVIDFGPFAGDTVVYGQAKGNTTVPIKVRVRYSSGDKYFSSTILTLPLDTIEYTIYY